MPDLFSPYSDTSIKDARINTKYSKQVVDFKAPTASARTDFLSEPVSFFKLYTLLSILAVGIAILLIRLFYLQIFQGERYRALAEYNRIHVEYLPAARGIIYDTHQTALVTNVPNFIVTLTPQDLPTEAGEYRAVLQRTAEVLELSEEELQSNVVNQTEKYPSQPLILKEFVPYDQAMALATTLDQLAGITVTVQAVRSYNQAPIFSHLLGYLSKIQADDVVEDTTNMYQLTDRLGKTGLEAQYEAALRGIKGQEHIEVTSKGNIVNTIGREEPIPGNNLVLSVDANLQTKLYTALQNTVTARGLPGGAAIAMDPRNGQIKALVSYPGFDNNVFTTGISNDEYQKLNTDEQKPLFNKAISGNYPSGSTFKLVVASAALQEQIVTSRTIVNSVGAVKVNSTTFKDWKRTGHGQTDIYKALAESVNTFFYLAGGGTYDPVTNTISGGLGINRITKYATTFGLGQTTGIDLLYEASGFVPTPEWKEREKKENWYIGDTYHVAIGQGDLLVTPLQVALYTSVVANGGTVYQPSLLQAVTNQAGDVVQTTTPKVVRDHIIEDQYLKIVRAGMREAVTYGSAKKLNDLPFATAGKTGTAQSTNSTEERNHSWFTVFAPYDNPELVITVLVEEGGEGSEAALPIAKEGLMEYFKDY